MNHGLFRALLDPTMKMRLPGSGMLLAWALCACAANGGKGAGPDYGFPGTRLQYALLTGDSEILRRDFRMNPERSPLERAVAGLALPFSAATEAAFWPVRYGLAASLEDSAEREADASPRVPAKPPEAPEPQKSPVRERPRIKSPAAGPPRRLSPPDSLD
jgi:hypothetical protein